MDNEAVKEPMPLRQWTRRQAFVPQERFVGTKLTVFATRDQTEYVRLIETGQIRRVQTKVKGKAARRADKAARRTAKVQK